MHDEIATETEKATCFRPFKNDFPTIFDQNRFSVKVDSPARFGKFGSVKGPFVTKSSRHNIVWQCRLVTVSFHHNSFRHRSFCHNFFRQRVGFGIQLIITTKLLDLMVLWGFGGGVKPPAGFLGSHREKIIPKKKWLCDEKILWRKTFGSARTVFDLGIA